MKKISLTADQKETRLSHHKKCCDKRECDRIKAVLLYAKDWSIASIADALLLHETSITRHINDFGKLTSTRGGSATISSHKMKTVVSQYIQNLHSKELGTISDTSLNEFRKPKPLIDKSIPLSTNQKLKLLLSRVYPTFNSPRV
jgi:hypothetical protein